MICFCYCEPPATLNAYKFKVSPINTNKKSIKAAYELTLHPCSSSMTELICFLLPCAKLAFLQLYAIFLSVLEIHTVNCFLLKTTTLTFSALEWNATAVSSRCTLSSEVIVNCFHTLFSLGSVSPEDLEVHRKDWHRTTVACSNCLP